MKKSKSFKKALLPAIALLIAAIVSLTSVTYAWFTYGDFATVDQIDVNVEAAGGLQISMGNNGSFTWTSNVDPNVKDVTLKPVSSAGNVTSGKIDFFTATYDDTFDKIYNVTAATNPAEGATTEAKSWISFDVYFRNAESKDKIVTLDETTVTSAGGFSNLAVRMAFVKQGSISSTTANQTPGAFDGKVYNGSDPVAIYEPNAEGKNSHTESGFTDYSTYNSGATDTQKFEYKALKAADTERTKGNYYNRYTGESYKRAEVENRDADTDCSEYYVFGTVADENGEKFRKWEVTDDFQPITSQAAADLSGTTIIYTPNEGEDGFVEIEGEEGEDIDYGKYECYVYNPVNLYTQSDYTDEGPLSAVMTTYNEAHTYFELGEQSVTKVTVYIWLEGQDADCDNAISDQEFSVNLKFNATAKS